MFKKIVLFSLLKVVEIGAIVFVPYWVGKLAGTHVPPPFPGLWGCWIVGVMCFVLLLLSIIGGATIIFVLLKFINFNWKIVNGGVGIRWIERFIW